MLKKRLMTVLVFLVSVMMGCTASPDTPAQETQVSEQPPAGKVKVENVTVKSRSADIPFMFSFDLPSGWTYRITADDAENKILTVSVWPEEQDEDAGNIVIEYTAFFGVCGTGLEQKEMVFNGIPAHQGFYDGSPIWDFISLDGDYAGCVILNFGKSWGSEYEPFVNTVLYSLQFLPAS